MRAKHTAQFMADLGIARSHSRPRVSNDNPFSESQFKTLKYCPQYPGAFAGYESANTWSASFFAWYNDEHRHEGIGLFTPADVYTGRHLQLTVVRQHALDAAYAAHPERFVRGRPKPPAVPDEVWINRPSADLVPFGAQPSESTRPRSPSGGNEALPALEAAVQLA